MRILFLAFLLFTLPFSAEAQRAFKPVRTALKAKNYKEAINQINTLRKDTLYTNNEKLCLFSIEAYRGLNDAENTKLYLKQTYDTLSFFSTTRQIIGEALRLDSLARAAEAQKGEKNKQSVFASGIVRQYMPNLVAATRYYYKRKKYDDAINYLRLCIELPRTPLGQQASLTAKGDTANAVLYVMSAFQAKKYAETHRYEELALCDSTSRPILLECLVYTAEAEKDTAAYRRRLTEGFENYPKEPVFFIRLADYYTARADYASVLRLTGEQLRRDTAHVAALAAQAMAQLNTLQLDSCISTGERLLQADSTAVEANYYIGASYVGKAVMVKLPDNALSRNYKQAQKQQAAFYKQAMPYLEKYREQAPTQSKQWAPLLYKVYLALNEGKKFAEIEKIVSQ